MPPMSGLPLRQVQKRGDRRRLALQHAEVRPRRGVAPLFPPGRVSRRCSLAQGGACGLGFTDPAGAPHAHGRRAGFSRGPWRGGRLLPRVPCRRHGERRVVSGDTVALHRVDLAASLQTCAFPPVTLRRRYGFSKSALDWYRCRLWRQLKISPSLCSAATSKSGSPPSVEVLLVVRGGSKRRWTSDKTMKRRVSR